MLLVCLGTAAGIGIGGYVANDTTFSIGPFTIAAGTVDIGTLILFLTFLKLLYQPMRDLSKLATLANTALSGTERIQEVLDQAPEVKDPPIPGPYTGPQRFRGEISFENVWMSYVPGQPVLKGISLHLSPGRRVALVGLSGGGKTTLVKLISRFYDIQQGVIKIDGVDIRLYPLAVLRNNISMVLKESFLFGGTIRENIAIGRPGSSIEQIFEVATKANIHETIMNLPEGYDTTVREQGKNCSGGQRQRIAIARALLRDAPILILDEPTAALDVEAEAEVMHALDQLVVNRTVIVISHRLSTLGQVDEILVLKQGLIAERGSYKDLKQLRGIFAGLLAEQNRYSAEGAGDKSILRSAFVPLPVGGAYAAQQTPVPITPKPPVPQGWPVVNPAPPMAQLVQAKMDRGPRANGNPQSPAPEQKLLAAWVVIEIDGKVIGERRLNKPVLTIGRQSGNDIQIPSQRVSRLHARIRWENGNWLIEDAESMNGLIYQGQRIDHLILTPGDRVYMAPGAVLQYKRAT